MTIERKRGDGMQEWIDNGDQRGKVSSPPDRRSLIVHEAGKPERIETGRSTARVAPVQGFVLDLGEMIWVRC